MYKSPKLLIFLNKLFMYIFTIFQVSLYIIIFQRIAIKKALNEFEKILIDNLRIPLAFFGIILVFE